ncbi:MAG: MEMO1 family protein [Methanosarcinaceae archaeon]|nr:MEMO1 family protein [Methanosarcinaceae archaeon]
MKKAGFESDFDIKNIRAPVVSGKFYSDDEGKLKNWLKMAFLKAEENERECGDFDKSDSLGVVSPHAGFIYSGETAASAINALSPADTYILIGPNHTGYGTPVSISYSAWNTPLGTVNCDLSLFKYFENTIAKPDESAHLFEHSLEVQIPFLQYKFKNDFKIFPICMGTQKIDVAKDLGKIIADIVIKEKEENNKTIKIIASSDLSHYVTAEKAKKIDFEIIENVLKTNTNRLYETVERLNASACGFGPIAILIETAKRLNENASGKLIKYTNSGEVSGDFEAVVGYAAIAVFI